MSAPPSSSESSAARRPALTVLLNDTRECGEPALFLIDLDLLPDPLREGIAKRVQRAGVYEVCVHFGQEEDFVDDMIDPSAEDEGYRCDWTLEFKSWMGSNAVRRTSYQHCLTQKPAPPPPSVVIHWI
jgi:predicted ATPase